MLKNMRRAPSTASTMSPARVRSPTTTWAPRTRSCSARSSSRCTMARTCSPSSSSSSTTRRLTLPTPPPAPVIRYMASLAHGPDRSGNQVAAIQSGRTVLMHLEVLLVGHHVEERRRRRVLDNDNGVPPRLLAVTDDHAGCGTGVTDGPAYSLKVRGDLLRVTQIALASTCGLELQQVDHHDRGVRRPRRKRRELLGRRFQR